MPKKRFKTVQLSETTFAELDFLAEACNMKKSAFLALLLGEVFDIGSQFKTLNILYTGDFTGAWLKLNFVGRSNIQFGAKQIEHGEDANPIDKIIKIKGVVKENERKS